MLELFNHHDLILFEGTVKVDFYLCLNGNMGLIARKDGKEENSSMENDPC
jgi:hypothetical protein